MYTYPSITIIPYLLRDYALKEDMLYCFFCTITQRTLTT